MHDFREYLRYAEKCVAQAEDVILKKEDPDWLLIPSIILAWSAIESFINNRCNDLGSLPEGIFELHERAFLLEKHLRFIDSGNDTGKFVIEGNNYQALENKIFFILEKLGSRNTKNLKGGSLWQRFKKFKDVRDSLVHPRKQNRYDIQVNDVKDYIETAKQLIREVSKRIWKKSLSI